MHAKYARFKLTEVRTNEEYKLSRYPRYQIVLKWRTEIPRVSKKKRVRSCSEKLSNSTKTHWKSGQIGKLKFSSLTKQPLSPPPKAQATKHTFLTHLQNKRGMPKKSKPRQEQKGKTRGTIWKVMDKHLSFLMSKHKKTKEKREKGSPHTLCSASENGRKTLGGNALKNKKQREENSLSPSLSYGALSLSLKPVIGGV